MELIKVVTTRLPFDVGALASLASIAGEAYAGRTDRKELMNELSILSGYLTDISLDKGILPAIQPVAEAVANHDFYSGGSIESEAQLRKIPENRINGGTSEQAIAIGRATGSSPIMIDHIMKGLLGYQWDQLSLVIKAMTDNPVNPSESGFINDAASFVFSDMVKNVDNPSRGGFITNRFYGIKKEMSDVSSEFNSLVKKVKKSKRQGIDDQESMTRIKAIVGDKRRVQQIKFWNKFKKFWNDKNKSYNEDSGLLKRALADNKITYEQFYKAIRKRKRAFDKSKQLFVRAYLSYMSGGNNGAID